MKKVIIIFIIIFLSAVALLWCFYPSIQKAYLKPPQIISQIKNSSVAQIIQNKAEQIFAPGPLRALVEDQNASLTINGVIKFTNFNRAQNGQLAALTENQKLNASASYKLRDMFKKQYFEHKSPTGAGPAELANAAGYEFIAIGENLALGNYKDDEALVTAWMNSPGHRANILNKTFTEIGVAVGKGIYEGKETWLAVQEFGKPSSSCPTVDVNLKTIMKSLNQDVELIQPQLTALKSQIDSKNPQTQSEYDAYNKVVADYNSLVKIYNNKVDQLKISTDEYNAQVKAFNTCAGN